MEKTATITGTVVLGYDKHPALPKECVCCPDQPSHVRLKRLHLPDHADGIDDWLKRTFDFKKLEGKRIKVTAELIDAGN